MSVGWCTPQDPTGDSFAAEHLDAGPATWLRMRTDVKKLPAEWLAVHRTAAEKAKGRPLNARERRELKDDLTERLLPRVLPKMGFVDALLFPDRKRVLLLSSSKSARETFSKLWFETFAVPLVVQGPLELAPADDLHRIEKLEPTCWPGGGSHMTATRFGWLGQEFLLWLWFRFETAGGEFRLPGGRVVGIAVDDLLAFAGGPRNPSRRCRCGCVGGDEEKKKRIRRKVEEDRGKKPGTEDGDLTWWDKWGTLVLVGVAVVIIVGTIIIASGGVGGAAAAGKVLEFVARASRVAG